MTVLPAGDGSGSARGVGRIGPEPSFATGALSAVLWAYQPGTGSEAVDLDRVRALVRSAADPWRRSIPLHLTASALIVHPASRRVLLRWHVRQRAWLQVGGHADAGESDPLAIVAREAREETGLEDLVPWPDAALTHLVVVPVNGNAREPAHEHADLRYVLATAHPELARPENPAAPLRWLSVGEACALTVEANLRESLTRLDRLFDAR